MSKAGSAKTNPKPKRRNYLRIVALTILSLAVAIPATLWASLLIMEISQIYCSECSIGWGAVIAIWFAIPTLGLGTLLFALSFVKKPN
jgi:hypothetical protein